MIEDVKVDTQERMQKSIETLINVFRKIRTGRAHTSLLDHILVPYYGTDTPLNQVANISVGDHRTLTVTPWEKKIIPEVEKAIMNADLGLNPITAGNVIRIPLPPLTEERRHEMIRVVRHETETARVAIRNIRRDANHSLKALCKDKMITEDEERRAEESIQKLTDKSITQVDELLHAKEADLMEV
uniref:Ribosome-recycling factor n=2 Tax=unclassified Candidatus Kentrum TaxID=2643149 RepID=A0A450ZXV9_9GAMM|nr:MAG: ribosome recycling factor [Candidatus Kentron sp. LPFa]VFK58598.1 MAG: ribosome recycling factor [Candidatus Kentron sp. UNK]VFK68483.1 MAG: ribosome recycling factor [Candidatus Kentron sp. UNK]